MNKATTAIIVLLVAVFLIVGSIFVFLKGKKSSIPPSPGTIPTQAITKETPIADRPYVSLVPREDGREFTMNIVNIKNADTIEYDLVYLSQGISRGVIGSVDLKGETIVSRKLLLGSCSRNVCKYDEGVTQGTLTLRFRGKDGLRKFSSDFHLQKGGSELSSLDGYFKAQAKLPAGTYFITMSTIGLPNPIEGSVLGQPYGIFSSGAQTLKPTAAVSLTPNGQETNFVIMFWDGKTWLMKTTNLIGVFVAVAG